MCFGGGGGGSQSVTQEFKPPEYTKQGWQDYLGAGQNIAQTPYQQSGIPQVAPINDYQNTAMQLAYNRALYGSPDLNAGRGAAMNAAQGNYANPMTQNITGIASGQAYNPAMEGYYAMANSGPNPYTSDEYTNQILNQTAGAMAKGYAEGGAAQNDAAAAMAGAYGGSGHEQMALKGQAGLEDQIGKMASQVLQQQQQYKGNMYNSDFANRMGALGGYAQTYQGDVGNQLAANQQASGNWQNDIQNILAGGGLAGGLSQQDFTAMQGLMSAGNNWNNYEQKLLDQYNNQWNTENQYDANMNEYLGSVLGRASGSYGTTAQTQPGQNTLAGLLGLGATGAGLYSLYK